MTFPRWDAGDLPAVDEAAMREVDRRMVDELGIDLPRMMENAGRNLAELAVSAFAPNSVTLLYGSGGNGGGALVAGRHLVNRGVRVTLVASSTNLTPVTLQQRAILERMGVLDHTGHTPPTPDLVIDGMVGYSLRGEPTGRTAELVRWTAEQRAPVLSLDVPTGFSAADGELAELHVRANATLTLALPKEGLASSPATGRLFLGDISVPQVLYHDMGLKVPDRLFSGGQVVHLL